jgi:hypothetical protein
MAGNLERVREWKEARTVCQNWCDDEALQALVAIAPEPGDTVNALWSKDPTLEELENLGSLFHGFKVNSAVSGRFVVPARQVTSGNPPLTGQTGHMSAGAKIQGYVSNIGKYLPVHSLGGLFQEANGTRHLLTAGHALWDADVGVWVNVVNQNRVGPVSVCSPSSFPKNDDVLLVDAGRITVDEAGLSGWTTPWNMPLLSYRKCGATTGCTFTKSVPKSGACVKLEYAEGVCVTLTDQLILDAAGFADGGDSGSLVETQSGDIVGMVVTVSDTGQFVVVTPWAAVLKALGLDGKKLTRLT